MLKTNNYAEVTAKICIDRKTASKSQLLKIRRHNKTQYKLAYISMPCSRRSFCCLTTSSASGLSAAPPETKPEGICSEESE